MAERVTDLRDIERRLVAQLVGEPEPGVPTPDACRRSWWPRTWPRPTPPGSTRALVVALVTERGGPDQPHRDHRPPARHPVRGRGRRASLDRRRPARALLVDGDARRRRARRRPEDRRAPRVEAEPRAPRGAAQAWTGPAATADGIAVKMLANVADGDVRRVGRGASPCEGVGLFRTELCFLNRSDEPSVDEQADIYAEVLDAVRRRPLRRRPHPRRRLRQAGRVRDPRGRGEPRARRARPAAVASTTPDCWTASSTPSPRRPSAPAPRPG